MSQTPPTTNGPVQHRWNNAPDFATLRGIAGDALADVAANQALLNELFKSVLGGNADGQDAIVLEARERLPSLHQQFCEQPLAGDPLPMWLNTVWNSLQPDQLRELLKTEVLSTTARVQRFQHLIRIALLRNLDATQQLLLLSTAGTPESITALGGIFGRGSQPELVVPVPVQADVARYAADVSATARHTRFAALMMLSQLDSSLMDGSLEVLYQAAIDKHLTKYARVECATALARHSGLDSRVERVLESFEAHASLRSAAKKVRQQLPLNHSTLDQCFALAPKATDKESGDNPILDALRKAPFAIKQEFVDRWLALPPKKRPRHAVFFHICGLDDARLGDAMTEVFEVSEDEENWDIHFIKAASTVSMRDARLMKTIQDFILAYVKTQDESRKMYTVSSLISSWPRGNADVATFVDQLLCDSVIPIRPSAIEYALTMPHPSASAIELAVARIRACTDAARNFPPQRDVTHESWSKFHETLQSARQMIRPLSSPTTCIPEVLFQEMLELSKTDIPSEPRPPSWPRQEQSSIDKLSIARNALDLLAWWCRDDPVRTSQIESSLYQSPERMLVFAVADGTEFTYDRPQLRTPILSLPTYETLLAFVDSQPQAVRAYYECRLLGAIAHAKHEHPRVTQRLQSLLASDWCEDIRSADRIVRWLRPLPTGVRSRLLELTNTERPWLKRCARDVLSTSELPA